jgi:hypothetical protein
VLDHDDPPDDITPSLHEAKHPTIVLLRRDWEFLFDQLKSTHAVTGYFERIVGGGVIPLGHEPVRYYDFAQKDAATPTTPSPAELLGGGELISTPLLPLEPVANSDRSAHEIVRMILEDIALTRLHEATEQDRLRVLAELDRLPVGQRTMIGRFVLNAMTEVGSQTSNDIVWRMRSVRARDGRTHLGFGACSRPFTEEIRDVFSWWVQLRHHDFMEAMGTTHALTTVAVLLTPRTDGRRPWDTSMSAVAGALSFTDDELASLRSIWPTPPEWEPSIS